MLILVIVPFFFFVHYVKSGNNREVAVRQTVFDLFVGGWVVGLTFLHPISALAILISASANFLAIYTTRNFKYFALLFLGAIVPFALNDFTVIYQSNELLTYSCFFYVILHFIILSSISNFHSQRNYAQKLKLKEQKSELEEQQEEIMIQAEELKALNESLTLLNNTLEIKVQQRTEELIDKNQRLADYAFINAHKLRAPVANILGLLELINYPDRFEEEKEEILRRLSESILTLDATIKEIRDVLEKEGLVDN